MNLPKRLSLLIAIFFIVVVNFTTKSQDSLKNDKYVIVLSMDAFRWDYPKMTSTPVLDSIAKVGVKAESLKPAFPTLTFPNHYSLATGLYPDHHGIVMNNFYDDSLNAVYRIGDRSVVEDGRFYGGEPIWITAQKQGLKTASFYWVGSEAAIKGLHPTYWKKYDQSISYESRIDTIISWLQKPIADRPRLIMCYFDQPDGIGHKFGPGSPEVNNMVTYLDSLVGVFTKKLNALPIAEKINFIILSDHGMSTTSSERVIDLSIIINRDWVARSHGGSPVFVVKAKQSCSDSILTALSSVNNLKAWKTSEMPQQYNFGKNLRTMDILILANNGWSISWGRKKSDYTGGAHGFDNNEKDMHAIFYATGPDFKKGYVHPGFEGVDIYSLLAYLLNIKPEKTDGNLLNTIEMLK
ncbi:MAG: ectonucleotide pyrophosphatase/phosphodiesterase [Bacteroidales bacterium]